MENAELLTVSHVIRRLQRSLRNGHNDVEAESHEDLQTYRATQEI